MTTGNLLDLLLRMDIQADGVDLEPPLATLNFADGLTVAVDTANQRYTVTADEVELPAARLVNYSAVDNVVTVTPLNLSGNFTVGTEFCVTPGAAITITGVRFYWAGGAATVRCKIWEAAGQLATVDLAVGGAGYFSALFATPYALPTSKFNKSLHATVWNSANYPKVSAAEEAWYPARPFYDGARIFWKHWGKYAIGDANITSSEIGCFPVEPILTLT